VQNYLPGVWVHTWSLAVEEHFYLALPVLLLILARAFKGREDPFRSIPSIYVVVAAATFSFRILFLRRHPLVGDQVVGATHLVVDALFLGVVISYYYHFRRELYDRWSRALGRWLLPLGLLLAAPCALPGAGSTPLRLTIEALLLSLGFGAILVSTLHWEPRFGGSVGRAFDKAFTGLAYLGSHSYSVYLWHAAMATWGLDLLRMRGLLPDNRPVQFLIYLTGSFVIGIGMARLIEDPVLRVRDRWFPSQSRALKA